MGVYQGEFAEKSLSHWYGQYEAIDAWQHRKSEQGVADKNFVDETTNRANYEQTKQRIAQAGPRARAVKAFSVDAAASYPDGHFDWIFIDTVHTRDAVAADLQAWWPKLRPGGLFSGDDYGDAYHTEWLSAERYGQAISNHHQELDWRVGDVPKWFNWGVISATQEFARNQSVALHVTYLNDCHFFPGWYIVKPPEAERHVVKPTERQAHDAEETCRPSLKEGARSELPPHEAAQAVACVEAAPEPVAGTGPELSIRLLWA